MENQSTEEILRLIKKCTTSVQENAARIDEINVLLKSGMVEEDETAKELFDEKEHVEHIVSELEKDIAMYQEILHVHEINKEPPMEQKEEKKEEEQQPEYDAGDEEEYQDEEEYEDDEDYDDCEGPEPSYETCCADPYRMSSYISDYQSDRYDGWDEVFTGGDY